MPAKDTLSRIMATEYDSRRKSEKHTVSVFTWDENAAESEPGLDIQDVCDGDIGGRYVKIGD